MKERGILFSAPMVRALLDGSKTQTRRAMRVQPDDGETVTVERYHTTVQDKLGDDQPGAEVFGAWWADGEWAMPCPYGRPGDRLWVREAYRLCKSLDGDSPSKVGELCLDAGYKAPWAPIQYEADGRRDNWTSVTQHRALPEVGKLRPGMFMCRWMSRITLEITNVRVERLQSTSEADCVAEGAKGGHGSIPNYPYSATPREHYSHIWEVINGVGSWEDNPWVWVVEFKRIES